MVQPIFTGKTLRHAETKSESRGVVGICPQWCSFKCSSKECIPHKNLCYHYGWSNIDTCTFSALCEQFVQTMPHWWLGLGTFSASVLFFSVKLFATVFATGLLSTRRSHFCTTAFSQHRQTVWCSDLSQDVAKKHQKTIQDPYLWLLAASGMTPVVSKNTKTHLKHIFTDHIITSLFLETYFSCIWLPS